MLKEQIENSLRMAARQMNAKNAVFGVLVCSSSIYTLRLFVANYSVGALLGLLLWNCAVRAQIIRFKKSKLLFSRFCGAQQFSGAVQVDINFP